MTNGINLLKIAYAASILILVPTVYNMLGGQRSCQRV
jgi:hypothetical protein